MDGKKGKEDGQISTPLSKAVIPYIRQPHLTLYLPSSSSQNVIGDCHVSSSFSVWRHLLINPPSTLACVLQKPNLATELSRPELSPKKVETEKQEESDVETHVLRKEEASTQKIVISPDKDENSPVKVVLKKQVSVVRPAEIISVVNSDDGEDSLESASKEQPEHFSPLFSASQLYHCSLQDEDEEPMVAKKKRRNFEALVAGFSSLTQAYVAGLEDAYELDDCETQQLLSPSKKAAHLSRTILSARPQIAVWPWQSQQSQPDEEKEPVDSQEEGPQKRISLETIDEEQVIKKQERPLPPEPVMRDFVPPSRVEPPPKPVAKSKPKINPVFEEDAEFSESQAELKTSEQSSSYCPIANLPKLSRTVPWRQRRIGLSRPRNSTK